MQICSFGLSAAPGSAASLVQGPPWVLKATEVSRLSGYKVAPFLQTTLPFNRSERGFKAPKRDGLIERVPGLRLCVDTAIIISSTPSFGSRPRVLARHKQTQEASNERGVVGKPELIGIQTWVPDVLPNHVYAVMYA
ncbi:unnamed protein product [Arctogadus glacialis]